MELKIMRIEVIKMTLQKRENSGTNIIYEIERPLKIYGKFVIKYFLFVLVLISVISYERIISINNLSDEILQTIMKYLTNQQLKKSCFVVNKQWNQCAAKGLDSERILF
jgi:hypothetical protein